MKQNPKLYGADRLECELFEAGWVRSPNNIHGLPSVHFYEDDPLKGASPIWYAGHSGMKGFRNMDVQVCPDRIRVFKTKFFGEHYTRKSFTDTVTVAVFDNVPDFLDWVAANGEVVEALPAFANGWD